ncbi:hypothetical protein [Polaromonas sp.]|uniref:hypothetical protein n=1 Tax=Polaromonas sp. TaxID=1869339 RepID=UPI0017B487A2|nr:hypothetical protein [Polaromonas sp.]NML84065.1 hypothetical protein [Polaromonas sp.]
MGRYAKPLLTAPPSPPIENGVEVLICEARLAHSATDDPCDIEEEQLMTVLVSFDPQPAQRYAARNLAMTYIAAQSTFEQLPVGCGLAEWLLGLLNSRIAASLYLVMSLPPVYSADLARQIEAVLAGLRNSQYHQLGLTVAVGMRPGDWGACREIDGFVASPAGDADRASIHVFNMLAALMAPGLTSCVDWEELRSIFGTHKSPSRVASGIWLQEEASFFPASAADKTLIEDSGVIALMPAHPIQISSQIKLMNEIRQFTENDPDFVMITPYGMSSKPVMSDQIVSIRLIAAPSA